MGPMYPTSEVLEENMERRLGYRGLETAMPESSAYYNAGFSNYPHTVNLRPYGRLAPLPSRSLNTFVPQSASDIIRAHRMKRKSNLTPLPPRNSENHIAGYPGTIPPLPALDYDGQTLHNVRYPHEALVSMNYGRCNFNDQEGPVFKKKGKKKVRIAKKKDKKLKNSKRGKEKRKIKIKFVRKKKKFKKISKKRLKKEEIYGKFPKPNKKLKKRLKKQKRREKMNKLKQKTAAKIYKMERKMSKTATLTKYMCIRCSHILCIFCGLALIILGLFANQLPNFLLLTSGSVVLSVGLCILAFRILQCFGLAEQKYEAQVEKDKWTFINDNTQDRIVSIA